MVETRFMLGGYSKAEVLFPPIVNLTSSMVQDMLQWGWKLEGSRMQPIVKTINCGACGHCKGENCNNAEEIAYCIRFRY